MIVSKKLFKKPIRFFLYILLEIGRHIILVLPRKIARGLAGAIGAFAFVILPKERAKMRKNMKEAFGSDFSDAEADRIGKKVFINLAKTAADVFQFPLYNRKRVQKLVTVEGNGMEKLDQALSKGKGVIVASGHLGNWELLAGFVILSGYYGEVVARKIYYKPFDRVLVKLRSHVNVKTIYRDGGLRQILKVLQENGIVGMVVDQDIEKLDGVFVKFFGKLAWTPAAPAKISMATGAPILPMAMVQEGDRYRFFIEDPIWPETSGDKDENVQRVTQQWSDVIEKYIRRYPDQWVWMHDRWRTRPDLELDELKKG